MALWSRMNEAWRDLLTLVAQLDRRQRIVEQVFTGPIASLTFDLGSPARPVGVVLASLYRTDTGAAGAVTWSWSWARGSLTTTSFAGLAAGPWRASFLVIGGA